MDEYEAWAHRRLDDVALDYLFLDASFFRMHPASRPSRCWQWPDLRVSAASGAGLVLLSEDAHGGFAAAQRRAGWGPG